MQKGIKRQLLTFFLPLLFTSLLLLTLWALAGPWFGARKGGLEWAKNTIKAGALGLHYLEEIAALRARVLALELARHPDMDPEKLALRLEPDEALFLVPGPAALLASHSEFQPSPEEKASAKAASGALFFGGKLAMASRRALGSSGRAPRELILIKAYTDHLAKDLSEAVGTEIAILDLTGTPVISSWRDTSGASLKPALQPEVRQAVERLRPGEIYSGIHTYDVPNYRGLYLHLPNPIHRGDDHFNAFEAITPIADHHGEVLGYVAIAAPVNAVLAGTKRGIWASLVLLVVLSTAGFLLTRRFADQLINPLSALAAEITGLTRDISVKYAHLRPAREASGPASERDSGSEIDLLRGSIHRLRTEILRADEITTLFEQERARALYGAKMASLGEMAATITHEVNNPLAAVYMEAEELAEMNENRTWEPTLVGEKLQLILRTVERAAKIVRGLLIFARSGENQPPELVSAGSILDQTIQLCEKQLQQRKIRLIVERGAEHAQLHCRSVQITQVLFNLIQNAIEAVEDRSERWIHVAIADRGELIEFSITDSGSGIPPSLQSRIMEPFFTTKPPGKGTGLGLSISRKIIEDHNGVLRLDSGSERTRFLILLPCSPSGHSRRFML
ncbi:MAG: ATP-binding protein [Oligoflexia bacterium]|nr:ATP-binding protein [Oligoflexia bacterium]